MISECIMAGDNGACKGLKDRHGLCGSHLCPFYKTVLEEMKSQEYCRKRLAVLGLNFKTAYKVPVQKIGGK